MKGNSAFHTKPLPKDVPGFIQKKEGPGGTIEDGWWGWRKLKDDQAKPYPQGRLRPLSVVTWYRLAAVGKHHGPHP